MTDTSNTKPGLRRLRGSLPTLLLLLLIMITRSTLADHYHVPSGSMQPALMPGDQVLVHKAAYGWRVPFTKQVLWSGDQPAAGDVVIFDAPDDGTRLIKRVVATGGDQVVIRAGRVFINGEPRARFSPWQEERYGNQFVALNLAQGGGRDLGPLTVPEGHVLVLGDHRGASRDGRYFGTVPASELYGRASRVIWRRSQGPVWMRL